MNYLNIILDYIHEIQSKDNYRIMKEKNNILSFINEYYEITTNEKNKIKSSDLLVNYNSYNESKVDSKKLKQMMEYNRFKYKKMNDGYYYTNLILKNKEVIETSDFI